jgi:outer membrane protein OmpA-like peptidoglycan-associated protein
VKHHLSHLAVPLALVTGLTAACARRTVSPQTPSGAALVVLVPAPEDATPGRATVTSGSASVELDAAGESTQTIENRPPSRPSVMTEADVQRRFGRTLADLPPAAQHFTLYFLLDSDALTPQSKALLPAIIKAVSSRPVPEVTIIGHTDTTASTASNYALGLKRATAVRGLLLATGLERSLVEATSHGEAEPLVPTPDDTPEPRNRRVEIVIR